MELKLKPINHYEDELNAALGVTPKRWEELRDMMRSQRKQRVTTYIELAAKVSENLNEFALICFHLGAEHNKRSGLLGMLRGGQ